MVKQMAKLVEVGRDLVKHHEARITTLGLGEVTHKHALGDWTAIEPRD